MEEWKYIPNGECETHGHVEQHLSSDIPAEEANSTLIINTVTTTIGKRRRGRKPRMLSNAVNATKPNEVKSSIQTRGKIRSYIYDDNDDDEEEFNFEIKCSPSPKKRRRRSTPSVSKPIKVKHAKPRAVRRRRFKLESPSPIILPNFNQGRCLPWTLAALALHMNTNESALDFCQRKQLLPMTKRCPVCHEQMLYSEKLSSDKGLGYVFRCSRRACQIVRSARSGTWFERSKLPIRKSLLLTYCFATNFPFGLAVHESSFTSGCTSPTTVSDWYSYCREVCVNAISLQMMDKMGGQGCEVEMDEIKLGEKSVGKNKVMDGQWVLGLFCRISKRVALFCIPKNKNDAMTVVPIIEEHIERGTKVLVNCLRRDEMSKPGYQHLMVNCDLEFATLDNGVKNNGIEKIWRVLKSSIPQMDNLKRPDQLFEYLCEFLWRRWVDLNKFDPFDVFLNDAAALYALQNEDDVVS